MGFRLLLHESIYTTKIRYKIRYESVASNS
ncbi:MAG: hypothetical protein METHSR3v1_960004 [Methanothrix sp.]|nr:MAG: hypothetical protein METHSR3v1_960004 [Methanothrix sp.]